jgi:hypothetical protein
MRCVTTRFDRPGSSLLAGLAIAPPRPEPSGSLIPDPWYISSKCVTVHIAPTEPRRNAASRLSGRTTITGRMNDEKTTYSIVLYYPLLSAAVPASAIGLIAGTILGTASTAKFDRIIIRIASGHPPGGVYAGLMKDYSSPS